MGSWWLCLQQTVYQIAVDHGWWKDNRNDSELIMLMVCELGEAVEWLRKGNPPSDHIVKFSGVEEELADVVIRIMDMAQAKGYNIEEAIEAKVEFNKTRPYKHGGKLF